MDILREKYKKGLKTSREYKAEVIDSTIQILKEADFESFNILDKGTYGSVVELKYPPFGQTYAGKIVIQELASIGEIEHWRF